MELAKLVLTTTKEVITSSLLKIKADLDMMKYLVK
jgi:hypothetical protein